jgi:DNA-binding NtrC family response regulator
VCISLASHAKVPTVSAEVLKDLPIVRALMQETTPYASTSSCQVPTTKLALENLALSYDAAKEQFERDYFTKLTKSAGSLRKAAELGRISRNTLSAKLKQLGIAPASDA